MAKPAEETVRGSLYNWLGFGNLNGKYWFVGREESIALSKCEKLDGWDEYFERRAEFDLATDFRATWEDDFGRPLATFGTTTWHYQIAFLLAFHGIPITSRRVKSILGEDPQFARTFSNHFSGEFLPCPKSSKNTIEPYGHIWNCVEAYKSDVTAKRMEAFAAALERNEDVDIVVTYAPDFGDRLRQKYASIRIDRWSDVAMDQIVLSELRLSDDRPVYLLETPFLGYGRIGYDAIEAVVEDVQQVM